ERRGRGALRVPVPPSRGGTGSRSTRAPATTTGWRGLLGRLGEQVAEVGPVSVGPPAEPAEPLDEGVARAGRRDEMVGREVGAHLDGTCGDEVPRRAVIRRRRPHSEGCPGGD